jgi:hypothetical protein
MASKKAGRLAGLAALAGLAYMANKKGETKTPDAVKSETKETPALDRDDSERVIGSRAPIEDERPAPTGMGEATKLVTPAKVARSEKAPSTSTSSETPRFSPRGSPVLSDNPRKIGNAKAVVAPGGDRSVRLDMPKAGKTGNAKAVVAQGGDRSARSDMPSPSSGSGSGGRTPRSDVPSSGLGGVRRPGTNVNYENEETSDMSMKRGGKVKKMASGGMASKRGDGIASKGKTRCKMY